MKLKVTKNEHRGEIHSGPVFPGAEAREFAYQGERVSCSMRLEIHGYPPARGAGKLNRDLDDSVYSGYELVISGFTGTALEVRLIGHRKDIVEQRRAIGKAVLTDTLLRTMQFGELCNFLFSEAMVFHDSEAFPKSVEEAMRVAYPRADTEEGRIKTEEKGNDRASPAPNPTAGGGGLRVLKAPGELANLEEQYDFMVERERRKIVTDG